MRVTAPSRHPQDRPDGTLSYRWTITILIAAGLLLAAIVVVRQDLLPWARGSQPPPPRPLSAEEANRLADMRQLNWQDARAAVRATVGEGPGQVHLTGWVDWRRPMVYLARSGPQPGAIDELVQAVPGLVAVRPGDPAAPASAGTRTPTPSPAATAPPDSAPPDSAPPDSAVSATASPPASGQPRIIDPHPAPPPEPPADGWRLRSPGGDGPPGLPSAPGTIDALTVLLLTVAAENRDAAGPLAETESRWLRRDRTAGYDVDVLLGPAILPSPPAAGPRAPGLPPAGSLASLGGAVQYWLDDQARLHRFEALLTADTPARVDLDRTDQTAPATLAELGGATIDPRQVTDRETDTLAALRQRNLAVGGGGIRLHVPTENGGTITGAGWLDWRHTRAYVALDRPDGTSLLWADSIGVATRSGEPDRNGRPPLPIPTDGWERAAWQGRGDERGGFDLDLLLNEALALSGPERDDPGPIREMAAWLRADEIAGTPVDVYEIPRAIEAEVPPGEARMRYWLDRSGGLRRLEIRTRSGGFGQLDLRPGTVPAF